MAVDLAAFRRRPQTFEPFPKGFYLIVGTERTIATCHDTLRDAQKQLHLFLQRCPNTVAYIAEIIPRERATIDSWDAL